MLTVGSLFSGIGGLDLGAERAGCSVIWQSEIDPYACRVLAKHWPTVPNLGDITQIDWSSVERPDVICGGYPCQPFSLAGVRQGESDPRHLWPHFANAIRLLRPRYAVLENVPGHLSLGFGSVLGDLAALGYDTDWDCIPAAAVGAPHLRYRVFVVAHTNELEHESRTPALRRTTTSVVLADTDRDGHGRPQDSRGVGRVDGCHAEPASQRERPWSFPERGSAEVADPDQIGRRRRTRSSSITAGRGQPTNGDWWATEPDVGRVAHGVPSRVDRLRCLGNAVVPQVAEFVFSRIVAAEQGRVAA